MQKIEKLPNINYDKQFCSNELLERGKDQASMIVAKINELVDELNKHRVCCKEEKTESPKTDKDGA